MPELTRRRDPDTRQETWLIHYGDVRVGVIAERVGNPDSTPGWQWSCGFYPGSHEGLSRVARLDPLQSTTLNFGLRRAPPFADPDVAARKLVEIASTIEPVQNGRIYVELLRALVKGLASALRHNPENICSV
jgi:hypothetical protein